jgi:hypothetical protein
MGEFFNELDKPILLLYTEMMRGATPGRCEYESLLEAYAFEEINNINLVVNQIENNFIDHMIISKNAQYITKTIGILNVPEIKHYQALFPKLPQASNTWSSVTVSELYENDHHIETKKQTTMY